MFGVPTLADDIIARPSYKPDKRASLDPEMVLTRYINHAKFVDMIGTQSLFFSRLLRLRESDPDEGRIATAHYLADVKYREEDGTNAPSQREAYRKILEQGPHQQAYVSCWYIGENEDERMWREYVADGEGVAVQTTVGQLLQQFTGGGRGIKTVTLAPITYADYDEASMAGIEERDDSLAALKYKGTNFTHENEMRAILLYDVYYIAPVLPKIGERLAVPLDVFANRFIIAPNATVEYESRVRDVLSGTSVERILEKSRL